VQNAGLATRVLAFVADAIVIDVVAWLVGGAIAVVASAFGISSTGRGVLVGAGAAVGVLWAVGYFVFFWSTSGQTPGSRAMRIRVQDADGGGSLPFGRALLRVLGAVVSALILFLGFALILVDPRRRGLHDLIARSVVVYVPRAPRRPPPTVIASS
jgi:uncharacterized RDD family membrane protein YckC